jgi:hypothetical protein
VLTGDAVDFSLRWKNGGHTYVSFGRCIDRFLQPYKLVFEVLFPRIRVFEMIEWGSLFVDGAHFECGHP